MRIVLGPDRTGLRSVFEDGRLVWEGRGSPPARLIDAQADAPIEHLACPDAEIRPGHVNAHTHVYSGLVPYGVPLPAPWPSDFGSILERLWWRLDRALDEHTLRVSARIAIAEALLSGTSTLIDHHESPSLIDGSLSILAEEAERLGIRALLTYGATERNHGRVEARAGLDECERMIRRLRQRHGHEPREPSHRVDAVVGLHAGFTVSDGTIREAVALADELHVGLHIHAAESEVDVQHAQRLGYAGVIQRLDAALALGPKTILAHGIHLSPEEVVLADRRGAWFVQNPRSNRGNGVGYPRRLSLTSKVALGTDGYPSCMFDEVKVAVDEGLRYGEPADLPGARLDAGLALAELHLGPGVREDRVAKGPGRALHVVVGGRVVVRGGRLVAADYQAIEAEAIAAASSLSSRMRELE